jgi:glycosyltransferase involved in cell wall biosynthesis
LALLKRTLFKADHIRFLSTSFQHVIISKGFINSTSLGKTFIDDNLLDINYNYHATNKVVRILFLSTVSRNKGVYLVLEVFERLYKHFENISLTIAGDGPELNEIKSIIRQRNIKGIDTPGYVIGEHKTRLLNESDIYVFPSYYEGMPLSLIEAMASGLPVVCSAVGAIPDFFVDGKMGFIIKEQNIETYYDALELLITNSVLRKDMGEFNYLYAKDNFLASINVRKISEEYLRLFESRDVS